MPNTTECTVLLFGQLAEITGAESVPLTLDLPCSAAELKTSFLQQFPKAAALNLPLLCALDQTIANDTARVKAGMEVALFPPVTGG